jgi:hypothetical protein
VYVFPVDVVAAAQPPSETWSKVRLYDIPEAETYLDNWDLVRLFLGL